MVETGQPVVAVDRGIPAQSPHVDAVGHRLRDLGHRLFHELTAPVVVVGAHTGGGHDQCAPGQVVGQSVQHRAQLLGQRGEARSVDPAIGRNRAERTVGGHRHRVIEQHTDQVEGVGQVITFDRSRTRQHQHSVAHRADPGVPDHLLPRGGLVTSVVVGGEHRGQTEYRHHRWIPGPEQPPRLPHRGETAEHGLAGLDGIASAWRAGADEMAPQGHADRVLDGGPAGHDVAEQLAHAVDMAGPREPDSAVVAKAPLVVAEPAGERPVDQRGPRLSAHGAGRFEYLSVVLDGVVIDLSGTGFDPRPFDGDAVLHQAELDQPGQVIGMVGGEPRPFVGAGGPAVSFPPRPVGGRRHALGPHRRPGGPPREIRREAHGQGRQV